MGAGAHRDSGPIYDGRDVVRMGVLHLERDDGAFFLRSADDTQRIDLAELAVRIFDHVILVCPDTRLANRLNIVDRGTEPDRLHDRRSTRLELVRRLAIDD